MSEKLLEDVSAEFEFDSDELEYYDAPISGWLRRKSDGALFAFECQPIIWSAAWHWTLVPAIERKGDPTDVIDARRRKRETWISVIEDRRVNSPSACRLVEMKAGTLIPLPAATRK